MKNFRAIGRLSAAAAAVALIATSAVPAFAATTDPTTAPAKDQKEPKASQKYCVSETVTGSRVPTKVCKTRAEWIAEEGFDPLARR